MKKIGLKIANDVDLTEDQLESVKKLKHGNDEILLLNFKIKHWKGILFWHSD
ncbi:hypothetical protein GF376_02100 [Candidatus Peregrinibacteria bacterium]|nr:hypothetical protein [Candidatus Peregrinibacteria bacterium]